jgi:hypothetical protein
VADQFRLKPAGASTKALVAAWTREVKRQVGHVTKSRDFESRLAVSRVAATLITSDIISAGMLGNVMMNIDLT